MGNVQFNRVTHQAIDFVHKNIITALETALSQLNDKQKQINDILQSSGIKGPDVDAYKQQLSDNWDNMVNALKTAHAQVNDMLAGDGFVSKDTCDFGPSQPTGPAKPIDHGISVTPGFQGHGYMHWREAFKNAVVEKIQSNWIYKAESFLSTPMLLEQLLTVRNAVSDVGQQVEATPWNALMDGMAWANPEDWSVPVIGGIEGFFWDVDNFISGVSDILDTAQKRMGSMDTMAGNGFINVTGESGQMLPPWPNTQNGQLTTAPYNGGPGMNVGGGPTLGGGPIDGGGGGTGGGTGDGGGGSGGGTGGGTGGDGGGGTQIPTPTLATTWADNQPDEFPQPQNLEDIAQELIRRQGGKHHLVLITHFGRPDANNWLVTIPDRGNNLANQDPNDPGFTDHFGSDATSLGGGSLNLSGAPSSAGTVGAGVASSSAASAASGTTGDSTDNPDSYLNNAQCISTEMDGHLSPYGQFVAEAIQKYATSQPADQGQTDPSQPDMSQNDTGNGAGGGFDGIGNQILNRAAHPKAVKLTCPPTSPNSPANLWLMGHGLGGLVAQNLAAVKPFPGDNPNLGPAHIVKGVVGFGAPIIGKNIAGVAYEFFKIKGDKLGNIPLDSVGVNDARAKDVQDLPNPFTSPPWQSSDPHGKNYVKDPNDPQLLHNAYADSDQLKNAKLPFDITGNGGAWGPTYVVVIPPSPTSATGSTATDGAPVATGIGASSKSF